MKMTLRQHREVEELTRHSDILTFGGYSIVDKHSLFVVYLFICDECWWSYSSYQQHLLSNTTLDVEQSIIYKFEEEQSMINESHVVMERY